MRRGLFREGKGPVLPRVVALTGYAEAPRFQSGSEGTDAHWELHEYTRIEKLCSVNRWNQRKNRAVQSFLIAVCGPIAFICLCATKVMGTGQKIYSAFLTPSPVMIYTASGLDVYENVMYCCRCQVLMFCRLLIFCRSCVHIARETYLKLCNWIIRHFIGSYNKSLREQSLCSSA